MILASAIRCRSCGAIFQSARPEDAREYNERQAIRKRLPQLRKGVILLLIFSIIPFTAPFAAVFGTRWFVSHRNEIATLPRLYSAISMIAVGVGIGQSLFMILATMLFIVFKT
jgi:hypothetical protein